METESMKKYPQLVSVFSEDAICVWMVLDFDAKGTGLDITNESPIRYLPHDYNNTQNIEGFDTPSNFIEQELYNNGWEDWFGWEVKFIDRALQNGIAPWQPFLVRFYKPVSYQCGSREEPEWDTDYYWEIVTVEKWRPSRVKAAWRLFLSERSKQWKLQSKSG